ncbi:hypothetical protein D1AOALGA4SA_4492 [Olavius algarvensis Delta 1 endosymbiont]|nr:hypothetical protein D1AOALGA4SA_4492 [Olavius algarvensis Delta 1 endosymbiont]
MLECWNIGFQRNKGQFNLTFEVVMLIEWTHKRKNSHYISMIR